MPGDVITVSPARAPTDTNWLGGDAECDHSNADQLSQHAVCRECGAYTLEQVDMPDELVEDKPEPHFGKMERV